MDGQVFGEFMEHLSSTMRKTLDRESGEDTISMTSLFKSDKAKDSAVDDDDGDHLLRLDDGNFLSVPMDSHPKSNSNVHTEL